MTTEPEKFGFKGLKSRLSVTREQQEAVEERLDRRVEGMNEKVDTRIVVAAFQSSI